MYAQGYDCIRGIHARLQWPKEWCFEGLDAELLPGQLLGYPGDGMYRMAYAAAFNPLRGGEIRAIARFDLHVTGPGAIGFDGDSPLLQIVNEHFEDVTLDVGDNSLVARSAQADGNESKVMVSRLSPLVGASGATFQVNLETPLPLTVRVYDASGRLVRIVAGQGIVSQRHQLTWDGRTDEGLGAHSGVYFVEFRFGRSRLTERVVLVR